MESKSKLPDFRAVASVRSPDPKPVPGVEEVLQEWEVDWENRRQLLFILRDSLGEVPDTPATRTAVRERSLVFLQALEKTGHARRVVGR